jgi:hypothetical protein
VLGETDLTSENEKPERRENEYSVFEGFGLMRRSVQFSWGDRDEPGLTKDH